MKWNLTVTIDGVNYTNRLIGEVSIEREQSTAAIARFEIAAQSLGTLDIIKFVGKEVIINYIQIGTPNTTKLVFKGIVDTPSFNISNKSIQFDCTDNLQNVVKTLYDAGSLTGSDVDIELPTAITGNLYDKTRWQIIEYLASSKPISYDLTRDGTFQTRNWLFNENTDIEYTLNNSDIIDGSVSVRLASRSDILNKYDIKIEYRFPQLCEIRHSYTWSHAGVCTASPYPTTQMILDAAESTGAKVISSAFDPVYPDGWYNCGGTPMMFSYVGGDRDLIATSASLVLLRRYSRDIKRTVNISVQNGVSINKLGTLAENESQAIDYTEFNTEEWINDLGKEPFIYHVENLNAGIYRLNYDFYVIPEVNKAIEFLVNRGRVKILESNRQNLVSLTLPYNVHLDIDRNKFVKVNVNQPFKGYSSDGFDKVLANGQIIKILETFNIESGSATKSLDIAVFRMDSTGLTQDIDTPIVAPDTTSEATTITGSQFNYLLLNWFTNGTAEQKPDANSYGLIADLPGVSDQPILDKNGDPTGNYHLIFSNAREFRIPTFDISSESQSQAEETYSQIYDVVIPVHTLEVQL